MQSSNSFLCEIFSHLRFSISLSRNNALFDINVWYVYLHLVDFYGKCR